MSGTADKVKGSIKETAGKVTGDRQTEAEGKADKAKGRVKDAAHEAKESMHEAKESVKETTKE